MVGKKKKRHSLARSLKKGFALFVLLLLWGQISAFGQQKADSILLQNEESSSFTSNHPSVTEKAYLVESEPENEKQKEPFAEVSTNLDSDAVVQTIPDTQKKESAQTPSPKPTPTLALPNGNSAPTGRLSLEDSLYKLGVQDGRFYYTDYHEAGTVTLLGSILFTPILGLIPAILCSRAAPKNLVIPNSPTSTNPTYIAGFKAGAHAKKRKKVWDNYSIALLLALSSVVVAAFK